MSDLNFELQPSIHIQIWRAFPTQTAPTEYSQALRSLLPNGALDLNFFEDFWGHQNPWLEGIEDFWHPKSEMNTNIYTIHAYCILLPDHLWWIWKKRDMVIIAIMLDPPSIHVPNFEFAVGAMFIQTSFGFERKPTRPVRRPVFSGETSWKSMLPSANTHNEPTSLSICLLGFRLSWCIVQLEMTSLRRVQIADSTTSIMCGTYRSSCQWVEFL